MGTRVDFYNKRGVNAEWLGSYAFDGYPEGVFGESRSLFTIPDLTESDWRMWVAQWLASPERNGCATTPDMGWPWPWDTSATTDYAYAYENGKIYGSSFGAGWFVVDPERDNWGESDGTPEWPDMSAHKAVTYGPRSGQIVLGGL